VAWAGSRAPATAGSGATSRSKEVLARYLRARFEREAMITAKLQHPAIVPIYEAGTWPDGSAFYAMRLVSGGTLAEAIEKTRTLEDRLALLPYVLALTEALGYAHSRRIVHRDLKPGNVLVGEFGETVVIDWGLAKELDRGSGDGSGGAGGDPDPHAGGSRSAELPHAGAIVGTPCFIAPEQAAGTEIDERADVYALGAILYNLLAGQPPYWDSTEHSADRLLAAAREVPPTPIEQLAPRTPSDLRAIVLRAMAHDPAARYPSAKEMAQELRRFQTGQLLGSREYSARERLARWIRATARPSRSARSRSACSRSSSASACSRSWRGSARPGRRSTRASSSGAGSCSSTATPRRRRRTWPRRSPSSPAIRSRSGSPRSRCATCRGGSTALRAPRWRSPPEATGSRSGRPTDRSSGSIR
jgi:serine/threonine protein kinase